MTNLVVDTERLVRVLDKLVDGECGIVWLNNSVGGLGRWHDRESGHHTIRKLLANLGDEKRSHTSTSTTTQRVGNLESLKAVTTLGFAADDVKNRVDKLSTLSVMTLRPVVTSTRLTKDEVVGTEKVAERTSTNSIHCTWLQVDEDCAGHVFVVAGLSKRQDHSRSAVLRAIFTSLK
jgi:hypothetical protein